MMYGCIGEHLPHSFSREIHEQIGDYAYELREIAPEALDDFLRARPFKAINVTIPYKQAVMPQLDWISETARAIGAVNTIVNREGRLYGYNTDFDGLIRLIQRLGLDLAGKKVLILGTGGTSRTALYAVRNLGAAEVLRVSRTAREGAITYAEAAEGHGDAQFIINTTPCGMYPHPGETPLPLAPFARLEGVVDAVYNPLRTRLVLEAQAQGIPAEGGLYMLVAQAVRAAEIFRDARFPEALAGEIYEKTRRRKENIVLIGMPDSGKSTVAGVLGARLNRPVVDADARIEERAGMPIAAIFARYGEAYFRDLESGILSEIAAESGLVVATGGGAVLRSENVAALRQNGRLFLLDRPLEALMPSDERPLGNTREKIERLYRERQPVYRAAADEIIASGATPEATAAEIESR